MPIDENKQSADPGSAQPQPGAVITPGVSAPPVNTDTVPAPTPPLTPEKPEAEQPPISASPTPAETEQTPEASASKGFWNAPEQAETPPFTEPMDEDGAPSDESSGVSWTASEFIAHEKTRSWYTLLAGGTVLLAVVVFFLMHDLVSVIVVLVSGLLLGVYASHQPRQIEYEIDEQGIRIGPTLHEYNEYRSFAVMPDGAFSSIVLMPLKRFSLLTTIYYPPEEEERIVSALADQLPFEKHSPDMIDRAVRRLRF